MINPATVSWRTGRALQRESEEEIVPCWCILIRPELVGPATTGLLADLERRDYPLQPLPPPGASPNGTFIKGTLSLSFSRHNRAMW